MLDVYTFGLVTVRRALPSEAACVSKLASLSRLQRDDKSFNQRDLDQINKTGGNLLQIHTDEIADPDLHTFVVETPFFETGLPITGSMNRQLAGCMTNYYQNEEEENQWRIGWFYPTECPYPVAELMLAATIKQAHEIGATSLGTDGLWEKHKELYENKALMHAIRGGNRMILAENHFCAAIDHLARDTGYKFNF